MANVTIQPQLQPPMIEDPLMSVGVLRVSTKEQAMAMKVQNLLPGKAYAMRRSDYVRLKKVKFVADFIVDLTPKLTVDRAVQIALQEIEFRATHKVE